MAYAAHNPAAFPQKTIPQEISRRFTDPLDCLSAHLMLECAEVLAGVKPANLVSLVNRVRPCGRNLYRLWHDHAAAVAESMPGLRFIPLQERGKAVLLFCYRPEQLDLHLTHAGIRRLLAREGYDTATDGQGLLEQLRNRIGSAGFPHEIGLFIGYPAKDVAAFMGLVKLPFACQGPWKIYGDPRESLCLAQACHASRDRMAAQLVHCTRPAECVPGAAFFSL